MCEYLQLLSVEIYVGRGGGGKRDIGVGQTLDLCYPLTSWRFIGNFAEYSLCFKLEQLVISGHYLGWKWRTGEIT